jgi:chemotaxis response regulator CheB
MGSDGALGMKSLKQSGAATIAQNEETCVVYGMPRAAVELGVVDQTLPLERMPHGILRALCDRAAAASQGKSSLPSNKAFIPATEKSCSRTIPP